MTQHPEELLAGYVGGSLSPEDRAGVESHLASCDHCRRELSLARGARSALASLEVIPAPDGLAQSAIDEAAGIRTISRSRAPVAQRRYRVMAFAAAAAVVALLAVTVPHLGSGAPAGTRAANPEAGMSLPSASVSKGLGIEVQHVDYDSKSVQGLATAYGSPAFADSGATRAAALTSEAPADVRDAASCLSTAFPDFGGRLIRLIRATFGGTPAYIGVYTEGSGAGGRPTAVSIRVASVDTCTILSFTKSTL